MRRRTALLALVVALAAAALAAAQAPASPLLTDADVKKFISDFKTMAAELQQLGEQVSAAADPTGPAGMLGVLQTSADAQRILARYGWSGEMTRKFAAVFASYLVLKLEKTRTETAAELQAQLAEIDRSPQIPADQKAALKAQLGAMSEQLAQVEASYRAQVHPDDLRTVQANEAALDALSDE